MSLCVKWHLAVGGREASHRQRLAGRSEHTEEVFMVLEETVRMNYTVNRRHEAVIYSGGDGMSPGSHSSDSHTASPQKSVC